MTKSKTSVHTLIVADKFVGECKTRHEITLLEPGDGHG